jgi:hypothetical protein
MERTPDNSSKDSAEKELPFSSWRSWLVDHRKHLLWVPIGLSAAIALFAPIDVLQFAPAKMFVNFMASFVHMINRLDVKFELTQVSQLYYSLMWASLPIIYYSLEVGKRANLVLRLKSNRALLWRIVILFGLIWIALLYILSYVSPDPLGIDGRDLVMLHSRLGMATSGGLIMTSIAALLKFVVQAVGCFPDIYNKRSM